MAQFQVPLLESPFQFKEGSIPRKIQDFLGGSPEEDVMGLVGPMGIAGMVGKVGKGIGGRALQLLRKGGPSPDAPRLFNPQSTLLPSEATRLKLLADEQAKLQTAFAEVRKRFASKTPEVRKAFNELEDITEELNKLRTTAANRLEFMNR